jgi:hypothetical protein
MIYYVDWDKINDDELSNLYVLISINIIFKYFLSYIVYSLRFTMYNKFDYCLIILKKNDIIPPDRYNIIKTNRNIT